jgi:tRNA modification GTPase
MSAFDVNDSIAAIASPPGPAVRGVIRMSGPDIATALQRCFESDTAWSTQRQPVVVTGAMRVAAPLKRAAGDLYYWPGPASYTRQRSAEFHCSGALPVLNEVMRSLAACGVRQAQPGEFTLRAFLAGRIDLTRAEAVLGVIDSRSHQEMQVALRQLAGGLSGPLGQLQDSLLETLAHLEAGLDFVEEDIQFITSAEVMRSLGHAQSVLEGILCQIDTRQLDKRSPRVVLLGRPNAGKSCLQNALTESQSSIVSDVAGTTRDYLIATTVIEGRQIQLIDTAGSLPDVSPEGLSLEEQAERQTRQVAGQADLRLFCMDGSQPPANEDWQWLAEIRRDAGPLLVLQTKADLPAVWTLPDALAVSIRDGRGLPHLRREMVRHLAEAVDAPVGEMVNSTANRCFESLQQAARELDEASAACQAAAGDEIVAAALRGALDQLAVVTGKVFTDDILDRVFSRFCIGK